MKRLPAALALVGLAALAGCEAPTEAPILEQRWILPVESTTISVTELLPAGVTGSGSLFQMNVDTFSTSAALQELCSACAASQGTTGPVPPFTGTITVNQSLPANVTGAVVTSGTVQIALTNQFNFDPIAGGGSAKVTLTDASDGHTLGDVTFTGTLPAGSTATRTLTVAAGGMGSGVVATTVVTSPGGQVTTIDGSQRLLINATPSPIMVSAASVNVANQPVTITPVAMDVEDIEDAVADRIQNGALILDITNPFGVALTAQSQITYPGGSIGKALAIGSSPTSTATLTYTGSELRSFLGESNVQFTGAGSVSPTAGVITLTPGQQAVIQAKLDVTLQIGG